MIFLRLKNYNNSSAHSLNYLNHYRRPRRRRLPPPSTSFTNNRLHVCSSLFNVNYTLNERLANIGCLFGAISIMITTFLLYLIFTTTSNTEKWYYIVAALINISLLVLLMILAILFDRFYLKRNIQVTNTNLNNNNNNNFNVCLMEQTSLSNIDTPPIYNTQFTSHLNVNEKLSYTSPPPPNYCDLYPIMENMVVSSEHDLNIISNQSQTNEIHNLIVVMH
jgi:hypothetical protein